MPSLRWGCKCLLTYPKLLLWVVKVQEKALCWKILSAGGINFEKPPLCFLITHCFFTCAGISYLVALALSLDVPLSCS